MSAQNYTRSAVEHYANTREQKSASLCPQKQFLTHLRLYPLVNSTREIIFKIPLTKQCATNIAPTLQVIRDTNPIKAVMDRSDVIAVGFLNKIDTIAPGLKTYDYGDLWTPFTRPINGTLESYRRVLTTGNESIKSKIIEPSAKTVHDFRDCFNYVIYDNDGKGIIASTADPLVAPLNDYLENLVAKRFPESKTDSKIHSSELSRTARIIISTIQRDNGATDSSDKNSGIEETVVNDHGEEVGKKHSSRGIS